MKEPRFCRATRKIVGRLPDPSGVPGLEDGWLDGDEGQSLIEFAVCLPVLLLIVTGILAFGVSLNNYVMLTDAVGIGARRLAVGRGQSTDACNDASSAVYSAAPFLTPANLSFTFVVNGSTYTGPTCSSAGSLVQYSTAQVQVTYPCTLKVYGMNFGPNCTLKAQTTEVVQ